jgi:hypothetical protein
MTKIPKIEWDPELDLRKEVPPLSRWDRFVMALHNIRYKYSVWPSLRIKMSYPWRWMLRLFRKNCGASVLCTFGKKPQVPGGPVYFTFTCRLKRWHKGPCREDKLLDWTCGPTKHRPGVIPVLRRATTPKEKS